MTAGLQLGASAGQLGKQECRQKIASRKAREYEAVHDIQDATVG
jgi:hypothetical protein